MGLLVLVFFMASAVMVAEGDLFDEVYKHEIHRCCADVGVCCSSKEPPTDLPDNLKGGYAPFRARCCNMKNSLEHITSHGKVNADFTEPAANRCCERSKKVRVC